MKPTPRTDKALCECERLPLSVSVIDLHKMANLARELERELEELQKDKARLDWIEEEQPAMATDVINIGGPLLWEIGDDWGVEGFRESIDMGMERTNWDKPPSIESAMGMPEVGANVDELGIGKEPK